MNIKQLEYFISLSEQLNFTRVAEQYYISQTAITLQIQSLENELGVKLFNRTNRKVELTPAGASFLEDARAIIKRASDAIVKAQSANTVITGSLNIGIVKGYEKSNLSSILLDFHNHYPSASLKFVRENVSELYNSILNQSLDIILNIQYSNEYLEECNCLAIGDYPLIATLPIAHPLSHHSVIHRKELKGYPFVNIKADETKYGEKTTIVQAFSKAGFLPNIQYVSDDIETTLLAVATGLGYALLPSYITDTIRMQDKIVCVPLVEDDSIHISAVWKKSNTNPLLPIFIHDYLKVAIEKNSL